MMTRHTLTALLTSSLMALTISQTAVAAPHRAPVMHHAPVVHHAPVHHVAPPPPRPVHRTPVRHYSHGPVHHDVAGALMAGAFILGAATLINNATASTVSRPVTTYVQPNTTTVTPTNTRFWCESEKGFYPDVRACPMGWTPIPAN